MGAGANAKTVWRGERVSDASGRGSGGQKNTERRERKRQAASQKAWASCLSQLTSENKPGSVQSARPEQYGPSIHRLPTFQRENEVFWGRHPPEHIPEYSHGLTASYRIYRLGNEMQPGWLDLNSFVGSHRCVSIAQRFENWRVLKNWQRLFLRTVLFLE